MPRGKHNKRYTPEFKVMVAETMQKERLSSYEANRKFDVPRSVLQGWERIYLEEGKEGLCIERRGRKLLASGEKKGRPPKFDKKVKEDLISEVQRLRAENDYLKKLNALVSKRVRQEKKHK